MSTYLKIWNMKNVIEEEEKLLYQLHCESSRKGQHLVSLRAYQIVDFSSQYGQEASLSYAAENFLGPPAVFPRSGDHAYSFQLRTYGQWWQNIPSYPKTDLNLPFGTSAESQDFIEFRVERRVIPILMHVYEVYNPGAIVKIFSFCYDSERWVMLWQGVPEIINSNQSHCFSATFEGVNLLSDCYRIEFHHKHLKYFCELDGMILYGEDRFLNYFPSYNVPKQIYPNKSTKHTINDQMNNDKDRSIENPQSCFDLLPQEVILSIMNYLDLQSLCNAAKVSRSFKKACYDPVLYKDLNLQLYWNLVDSSALKGLQPRLGTLKCLNLSWCGGQGRITPPYFIEFLEARYENLSVLKLNSCPFVNNFCMKAIANCCHNLEVLEMKGCRPRDLNQSGFRYISQLPKLTYLDLYRSVIDTASVIAIIRNCANLQHLLLGSCTNIELDEVARAISKHLKGIRTLDFWRGCSLTCVGIYELADHCHSLVELDLGWCCTLDANCGCLRQLIIHNRNLKKLFLTAIRTVSVNEVNIIGNICKDLEQLDILGTSETNLETCERLLESCPKLKLLDVSYCNKSVKEAVSILRERFPSVEIKCVHPPDVLYS